MEDICKSSSEVRILNKTKLELRQGEVRALLGKNGIGKSALIKILGSVYTRNGGEVYANGQETGITDVESAKKYEVRTIHQELMLTSYMAIAEGIFLGQEPRAGLGTVDTDKMSPETAEFLTEVELSFRPTSLVGKLNIAQQQIIEIMRVISFGAKIIVMDGPALSLTDAEAETLFKAIRKLKENGADIVHVNHRVSELDIIANRMAVMRDGEYVDTMVTKETDHDKLTGLMMGRSLGDLYEERYHATGEIVLRIEHLLSGREVRDVTSDLHKREVLGFSRLAGFGRSKAMKCIFGLRRKEKGKIYISGREIKINSVRDATGYEIGLVPEDRKKGGIYAIRGVRFNTTVEVLREFLKNGRYDWDKELALTKEYVDGIIQAKCARMKQPIGRFSGGGRQEITISRRLLATKNILILNEPTRGIGVKTKSDIYHSIDKLTAQGLPIILVSSETPELTNICNRIIVVNQGYAIGVLERGESSQEQIMSLTTTGL